MKINPKAVKEYLDSARKRAVNAQAKFSSSAAPKKKPAPEAAIPDASENAAQKTAGSELSELARHAGFLRFPESPEPPTKKPSGDSKA